MVLKSYCPTDLEQFFPIEMLQDRLYYRHGQFELLGNPFCRTVRVGINSLQGQIGKEAKLKPRAFSAFTGDGVSGSILTACSALISIL